MRPLQHVRPSQQKLPRCTQCCDVAPQHSLLAKMPVAAIVRCSTAAGRAPCAVAAIATLRVRRRLDQCCASVAEALNWKAVGEEFANWVSTRFANHIGMKVTLLQLQHGDTIAAPDEVAAALGKDRCWLSHRRQRCAHVPCDTPAPAPAPTCVVGTHDFRHFKSIRDTAVAARHTSAQRSSQKVHAKRLQ